MAAEKSDAEGDNGNDTLVAIEQLERQLQHHYELACKKAEMQESQRSAVLKKLDSITAELQSHAIKVENGLEGKKEILNEMILLEKEAWQMIDNTPTLPNFDEIDQVLENVSHSTDSGSDSWDRPSLNVKVTRSGGQSRNPKNTNFIFKTIKEVQKINEEDFKLKELEEFKVKQLAKERQEIFELEEKVLKGMDKQILVSIRI